MEGETVTTDIARARSAREALLTAIGDDPSVDGVAIALVNGDGYRLEVRLRRDSGDVTIPEEIAGVSVQVTAA